MAVIEQIKLLEDDKGSFIDQLEQSRKFYTRNRVAYEDQIASMQKNKSDIDVMRQLLSVFKDSLLLEKGQIDFNAVGRVVDVWLEPQQSTPRHRQHDQQQGDKHGAGQGHQQGEQVLACHHPPAAGRGGDGEAVPAAHVVGGDGGHRGDQGHEHHHAAQHRGGEHSRQAQAAVAFSPEARLKAVLTVATFLLSAS